MEAADTQSAARNSPKGLVVSLVMGEGLKGSDESRSPPEFAAEDVSSHTRYRPKRTYFPG